ncbi:hypothetical protein GW7_14347 [Heterocephalus glaber]|uniref:Uncharacterized protein n=1 Tax=Heterocephalus glaber TaxID=10181 RepID=G5C8K5_HETGA|nr:hypothetical protein GW7_14347 [Heterocephalus glaber]
MVTGRDSALETEEEAAPARALSPVNTRRVQPLRPLGPSPACEGCPALGLQVPRVSGPGFAPSEHKEGAAPEAPGPQPCLRGLPSSGPAGAPGHWPKGPHTSVLCCDSS